MVRYGLAVIGGGSGGSAAALAAVRLGLTVVVLERGHLLGGTATQGGVNCWEMGAGGTGIPFDIYRRMHRDHAAAIGVYSYGRHFSWQDAWYWPHALDKVNFPGVDLPDVLPDDLRASLRSQHVQLDWPMPAELAAYLRRVP